MTMGPQYALVTPARNEEDYLERVIQSVVDQTIRPVRYVIVSDGSTDRTEEIADRFAREHDFIRVIRAGSKGGEIKNFGSKVRAFQAGHATLGDIPYDYLGNLDADVSFGPDYFATLLKRFESDRELGLSGGDIRELVNGKPQRRLVSKESVSGAVQLFRRQCFDDIGGYRELDRGGIDAAAEIMARMKGWRVRLQDDVPVIAHRRVLTGRKGPLATRFNKGAMNYNLGYHPLFHLAVSARQMLGRPYIIGGLFILAGYFSAMAKGAPRGLPADVVQYLRAEQLSRLKLARRPVTRRATV